MLLPFKLHQARCKDWVRRFRADQQGQDLIEYALLAAAGALALASVMPNYLFPVISSIFSRIGTGLSSAGS